MTWTMVQMPLTMSAEEMRNWVMPGSLATEDTTSGGVMRPPTMASACCRPMMAARKMPRNSVAHQTHCKVASGEVVCIISITCAGAMGWCGSSEPELIRDRGAGWRVSAAVLPTGVTRNADRLSDTLDVI